jgi:hypothetical protein
MVWHLIENHRWQCSNPTGSTPAGTRYETMKQRTNEQLANLPFNKLVEYIRMLERNNAMLTERCERLVISVGGMVNLQAKDSTARRN